MSPKHAPAPALIERLARVLPAAALMTGEAIDPRYQEDRRGRYSARPLFVLRPGSTEEVAACLSACNDFAQPLIVQGGRTGLSGGHRILDGEAVLSTERMTGLAEVAPGGATIIAETGAPLQAVQEAASAAGMLFGVDIGARGTATIGGNIATNAGGIRVLRYGMFRAQVAGLETVLADGTILSSMRGLDKDNSGYDLNQLFIGSEGTLGVVTRALLRLHPKPAFETNAFLAVSTFAAAVELLRRLRADLPDALSAYEIMLPASVDGVCGFLGIARPVQTTAPYYVLTEVQSTRRDDVGDRFEQCLMQALEDGVATDAVVSQSMREFAALWTLRDACADFVRTRNHILGCDISVPLHRMEAFLTLAQARLLSLDAETEFIVFGHLGDGNLHYVVSTPRRDEAAAIIYGLVAEHGGAVSAEHGIGVDKKPWLHLCRSPQEIETMRRIKTALDPRAILNRGRIFAPEPAR